MQPTSKATARALRLPKDWNTCCIRINIITIFIIEKNEENC